MVALDPRINPFRPEIAAEHLKGQVEAKRFVEGARHSVIEPVAALRRTASHEARLDTQALFGETMVVYETSDESWVWGQLETDGYVGWMPTRALGKAEQAATHKVAVPRALAFAKPDIKTPPVAALPMGARIAIVSQDARFAVAANRWHLPLAYLAPLKARQADFAGVAEQFLHTPYLWGGKTSLGLDCSGLVQIALHAAGYACPRDSDMQELALGKLSPLGDLLRGDLIFWKGHVAIARDRDTLLHANAHHMMVAVEPVGDAIARIKAAGSEITSVKRI